MALVIKPNDNVISTNAMSIFLAGTIDTHDWQKILTDQLNDLSVTFFNPRRDNWRDEPLGADLRVFVDWEFNNLAGSDLIIVFLDPLAKTPPNLLEIGPYIGNKKIFIACPRGFWRRSYMQLFCQRFTIPFYSTLSDLAIAMRQFVETNHQP